MALEIRKIKNQIQDKLNEQTIEDKQNSNSNDILGRTIAIGLTLAGGAALYRSGMLSPIAHGLKEFGANVASFSSNSYKTTKTIKNWANNKTQDFLRPTHSLLNSKKTSSLGYDLWQDLQQSFNNGEIHTSNIRRIINDTADDINILNNMIQREQKGYSQLDVDAIRKEVLKTMDGSPEEAIQEEINKRIADLEEKSKKIIKLKNSNIQNISLLKDARAIKDISDMMDRQNLTVAGNLVESDLIKDFIKNNTLTEEMARKQLKETRFKSLTLGDIFESYDLKEKQLVFKEGFSKETLLSKYNINLDEPVGPNKTSILDSLNSLLSDNRFRYAPTEGKVPKAIGIYDDVWKNLVLDPGLNIDKSDKIINYMMGKDALSFFVNSLRQDFGLPMLKFNPIDSAIKILPIDNYLNDKSVRYDLINGIGNYSPFISGVGRRGGDDISTALQKRFGKEDENFHLLLTNGDLYALGTKGTKEFIGSGYKGYNINGADKKFKLPHSIEALRTMGGYDLNRDFTSEVLDEFGQNFSKDFDPHMTIEQYEQIHNIQMTPAQKLKYEIGRRLDIGYQEFIDYRADDAPIDYAERSNIDNFFDDIVEKATHSVFKTNGFEFENYEEAASVVRDKTYEMAFGKTFDDIILPNGQKIHPHTTVLTKEGVNLKNIFDDVVNKDSDQLIQDFNTMSHQYFVGFDKNYNISPYFNERSSMLYDVFNALDSGLSSVGLGLSLGSKRSTGELFKNLIIKRALPVYMLTQVPGMIDYFSEPIFTNKEEKQQGINDTFTKTLFRNVIKPIDIGVHGVGDILGFNSVFKKFQELTPGSEHFTELPLIYQLGLGQTKEEREHYIESGYDPVRKNRYWSASNTPFTGSKIDHWRPNLYRRIQADVKFSDTMYGSRKEYYQNTWYPNLVSPLAPVRHFITDPNHWDKKHYYDRPYAETAPKGENIPLIGPLVSGTVGQIYRHKMHEEYWNPDGTLKPVNPEDEKPSSLLTTGVSNNFVNQQQSVNQLVEANVSNNETFTKMDSLRQEQYIQAANQRILDLNFIKNLLSKNSFNNYNYSNKPLPLYDNAIKSYTVSYDDNGNAHLVNQYPYLDQQNADKLFTKAKEYSSPLQSSTLPYRDYDRYNTALDVYVTPSGQTQIVDVPENLNLYKVNKEIQHYSLNKIYGTNQRVNLSDYEDNNVVQQETPTVDNSLKYSIGKELNDLANIYGLKGFMIQTLITGESNVGATQVETSSYAYSANRSFWDQNLGGLGAELSEISRRFIHKKDKNTEYLNPIRNTMPTWMPGSNYFIDFLHGDPYSKIMNGEERLPGEGYERLNDIHFDLSVSSSMIGYDRSELVKHFLHQDTNLTYEDELEVKRLRSDSFASETAEDKYKIQNLNKAEELISKVMDLFRDNDVLLEKKYQFYDRSIQVQGKVDAIIKDYHSRTGRTLINFRGVSEEEFNTLQRGNTLRKQDYYEMNYDLYALNNKGRGYIYYYNKENPDDIYKARVKFNKKDLRDSIQNLDQSRVDIYKGLRSGEISRGDLYPLIEKYKILADTAPYSQEFKDISAQVSHAHLTEGQKLIVKEARDRMKQQKEPLRVYDYKFKTSNLRSQKVTVKKVVDNNTIIVNEYGKEHAIKFAGINVTESNSSLYAPTVKERKRVNEKTGRTVTERTGKTMNQAANEQIKKYLTPGKTITIQYDYDEANKYNKDSTRSIRAIVNVKGKNLNRLLVKKGFAKEKENDDSAAGIHARYSSGEIAFGSMMETLTHTASKLPFVGDKFFQIRSPYEQYRKREVYNKDFKSWNHPIRDYLIPTINETSSQNPIAGIAIGAFIGSLFGKNSYGRMVGGIFGATIPAIGQVIHAVRSDKDHEWRPYRRRQQEEVNTYIDTLKYVKNMRLYNQYKEIAKKQNNFDVDKYLENNKKKGEENKERARELNNYKRLVKLDFKHRGNYNFKYEEPKYATKDMTKKETIRAINKELAEISSDRKIEKLPLNAIKAISYKQAAEKTMYGYEPGDDIRNIMSALPKKERQYYSKLVEAPEEEKQKILRIAPSYLRRALQASWGMHVDEKPTLEEYFIKHALPDENWVGWQEDNDLEDVKVKIVNSNGLDPGEYDIWENNKKKADQVNIPIPKLKVRNNADQVVTRLNKLMNGNGFNNVQISYSQGINNNNVVFNIREDSRNEVEKQINNLEV